MTSQTEQTARRSRHADGRRGRHQGADRTQEAFSRGFEALGRLAMQGVQVSGRATDLASGEVLFSVDDHVVMPTASIGKVLLLVEVAARMCRDVGRKPASVEEARAILGLGGAAS